MNESDLGEFSLEKNNLYTNSMLLTHGMLGRMVEMMAKTVEGHNGKLLSNALYIKKQYNYLRLNHDHTC